MVLSANPYAVENIKAPIIISKAMGNMRGISFMLEYSYSLNFVYLLESLSYLSSSLTISSSPKYDPDCTSIISKLFF